MGELVLGTCMDPSSCESKRVMNPRARNTDLAGIVACGAQFGDRASSDAGALSPPLAQFLMFTDRSREPCDLQASFLSHPTSFGPEAEGILF